MKKMIAFTLAVMLLAAVLTACGNKEDHKMKNTNWAYGAYTMNNADLGIGTVYYARDYFTVQSGEAVTIFNPNTGAVYTADEISAIVNGAREGAEGYVMNIPENAAMGISANGTGTMYWYDSEAAKAILSHTDALILNGETGSLATAAEGAAVADPIR